MNVLALSDVESHSVHSPNIARRFPDMDMVVACGDLSYGYLEYVISMLDVPLYYVRGNHDPKVEYGVGWEREGPWGGVDLHRRCVRDRRTGTLLAGIDGCLNYNNGLHQYSQRRMWFMVILLSLGLMANKLRFGRYLDIFVTHAPMWKVHDQDDLPHQGIKAYRWLVDVFQPRYHLHGHTHVYKRDGAGETLVKYTRVVNTYGYRILKIQT